MLEPKPVHSHPPWLALTSKPHSVHVVSLLKPLVPLRFNFISHLAPGHTPASREWTHSSLIIKPCLAVAVACPLTALKPCCSYVHCVCIVVVSIAPWSFSLAIGAASRKSVLSDHWGFRFCLCWPIIVSLCFENPSPSISFSLSFCLSLSFALSLSLSPAAPLQMVPVWQRKARTQTSGYYTHACMHTHTRTRACIHTLTCTQANHG